MSFATFACLTLCVAVCLAAPAAPGALPPFPGYLLVAQYQCDDLLCPDWELDISRTDTAYRFHETLILQNLVPKAPIAQMSFPVRTAYHNVSRTFYVAGMPEDGSANIWASKIDNNVSTSTPLAKSTVTFPSGSGNLVRLHASRNNTLLATFEHGLIAIVDVVHGTVTPVTNILADNVTKVVLPASTIDFSRDILYIITESEYHSDVQLRALDLRTLRLAVVALSTTGPEKLILENLFDMHWIPNFQRLVVFAMGNFDQILYVDPILGNVVPMIFNLAEDNLLAFNVDSGTKSDDTYQTTAFDWVENKLYFQCTQYQDADDGIGTTSLAFLVLNGDKPKEFIPTVTVEPFEFGFMGFHYANVISNSTVTQQ